MCQHFYQITKMFPGAGMNVIENVNNSMNIINSLKQDNAKLEHKLDNYHHRDI